MGGKSSSSNQTTNVTNTTTTTTNTNGTSGISGDNNGAVVAGANNSKINITTTDHGAVKAAAAVVDESLKTIGSSFGDMVKGNSDTTKEALDNMRLNSADTVSAVRAMATQSQQTAKEALLLADNVSERGQIGDSGEMSKVAIAVTIAMGVGAVALAVRGAE